MSARRFKGYRVGIIKPDGARRYMKPRSDGKWSLSETKPMLLDEDEMSDALDDVGDFMVGGDVSFSTPVFATRKPKPAPAVVGCGKTISVGAPHFGRTTCGASDSPRGFMLCTGCERKAKRPAPVVAAEGRYAVLFSTQSNGVDFTTLNHADAPKRRTGSREEALRDAARIFGSEVVRILPDGAHEAALAAARREERERVSPLLAALEDVASDIDGDYTPKMLVARFRKVARTALAAHEAAKGQAK